VLEKLLKIPFVFLLIAGGIGLLLRWYMLAPMSWLTYPNWLHAHSHIMFLGWIGNFLMLAYISNQSLWQKKRYRILFYAIQCSLAGMLISFPLQGYGIISILLSALHTVAWWLFTVWYFIDLKKLAGSASIWYSKISLVLFVIASLGPFVLGTLTSNGVGHSNWYYFALYYYLHFQYNGFFIFGIMHLFFHLLESKGVDFNSIQAKRIGKFLLVSIFPMYFLSIVSAKPGIAYNIIGFSGGMIQLVALLRFISFTKLTKFSTSTILWNVSILCFMLKTILQLLSAAPQIAQLALEVRPFVIGYLHLVVIGTVSFSIIAWCIEKGITGKYYSQAVLLLLVGFISSEIAIIASGIALPIASSLFIQVVLFLSSLMLIIGIGLFLLPGKKKLPG